MISIEKASIREDGVSEIDKRACTESNRSNSDKPPVNTSDERKILALEKSVSFLRTQHALMLEGLHKEIENLRQVNRALQFRVVMCCCKLDDAVTDEIKRLCTTREQELISEINNLKELLEAERKRNQTLVKQIESLQLGRSVVRDQNSIPMGLWAFSTSTTQKRVSRDLPALQATSDRRSAFTAFCDTCKWPITHGLRDKFTALIRVPAVFLKLCGKVHTDHNRLDIS